MSRKVWISLPLITSNDPKDSSVVGFTKGGLKKELELETATFITKWLMDRSVPFAIDFEASTVDRNLVLEALPRRLQKVLGHKVGGSSPEVVAENAAGDSAEPGAGDAAMTDDGQNPEVPADSPFANTAEESVADEGVAVTEDRRETN